MVTPAAKREEVARARALLNVSKRWASWVVVAVWTVICYQLRRDEDDALRGKLR